MHYSLYSNNTTLNIINLIKMLQICKHVTLLSTTIATIVVKVMKKYNFVIIIYQVNIFQISIIFANHNIHYLFIMQYAV